MDRKALRSALRDRRRALSGLQQEQAAAGVLKQLKQLPEFSKSRKLAVYLANDGEISPECIVQYAWHEGKSCYLPVLDNNDKTQMYFQRYTPETVLLPNRFNIPEPVLDLSLCIPATELDLVLMPLTGFDESGGRLGMGGGFYDRAFAFVKTSDKPVLVGLAHECQKVESIPVAEWDVPMSGIVTEGKAYNVLKKFSD
ncbi:5-formyltetrahydrofolate cyclo-ligase [Endozoicomonas gorgoniicola]|uniref:5-formyltetrahydrofolate cyclo-ligase n=1 Tax=Endozoicomonas gorgoniicola TaxID=1234144 RepID=A0ABT3MYZ9_9GAMM|nr:5-formyltetrahydrofolate cyclo-ligase [Endozoicomonas gorgoniicola]MCW7554587.1 5-formyltetrahydrofolate cyclo-ligase [Endozoicomonas gorgoniicola]